MYVKGLRYYYEVLGADYTTLLIKARSIEAEKSVNTSTTLVTLKSATPVDQTGQNGDLGETDRRIDNYYEKSASSELKRAR